jgi:hypothetical protein
VTASTAREGAGIHAGGHEDREDDRREAERGSAGERAASAGAARTVPSAPSISAGTAIAVCGHGDRDRREVERACDRSTAPERPPLARLEHGVTIAGVDRRTSRHPTILARTSWIIAPLTFRAWSVTGIRSAAGGCQNDVSP